jgi:hemerythrin
VAAIEWTQFLSVNVAAMDQQHKKLLQLINDLQESMTQGKGDQVVGNILGQLVSYTKSHFADEEILMAKHSYPGLPAQKTSHAQFTAKVIESQQKLGRGEKPGVDLLLFLGRWLVEHIKGADKQYGAYFNSRGVS